MVLYAGLMSGTSLDGVDAVLADFSEFAPMRVLAHVALPMPVALRAELLSLNTPGEQELHRAALAANALARLYAQATQTLLKAARRTATDVTALGAHGQTVRHRPGEFDGTGYTSQLLNGALLAELTGIDVVCDLRSRDVAAGGQGAPLVPAFHAARFAEPGRTTAVLNIGGIANLSLLHADGSVGGFDCGPGNVLMDLWCQRHRAAPYDAGGNWAACGTVLPRLLTQALAEPFFARQPPKSTGRDLFHATWLDALLSRHGGTPDSADVQATLAELTVRAAADALLHHVPDAQRLLVCGGGALNGHLMRRFAATLPGMTVASSDEAGLPPMQVEACAFAWLAQAFTLREPANRPEVTGARGLRLLGALYPA
jgi:anhydro-N-acetylmuramic acid kinase